MTTQAPQRAYRLTLKLDADTRDDLTRALCNLAARIEREQVTRGVWGGPTDGAIYELLIDPAITHQTYFVQVRQYLSEKEAQA